jgi:hypothetical protein
MNAYDYGVLRGRRTGRPDATEADYEWLGQESDGEFKAQDAATWKGLVSAGTAKEFEAGMRDGAEDAWEPRGIHASCDG